VTLEAAELPVRTPGLAVALAKLVRQLRPLLTEESEAQPSTRNPAA